MSQKYLKVEISLTPYEGLKHIWGRFGASAKLVEISLTPYEGLKQTLFATFSLYADSWRVEISLTPYEGLKRDSDQGKRTLFPNKN